MANDFDPLKDEPNKSSQGSHPHKEQNKSISRSVHRLPSYKNVWKRMSSTDSEKPIISANNQEAQPEQSNPFSDRDSSEALPPPFSVVTQLPQGTRSAIDQAQVHIIEQKPRPYWESEESSFDEWNQEHPEGAQYATEQASSYGPDEYYTDEKLHKQKGLSHKIDRLVQRLPALGVFYKQPPSSPDKKEIYERFKYEQTSGVTSGYHHPATDLNAEDLALNRRYSEQTRIQVIDLQANAQTQPVDVCIHPETDRIYLCDLGRSVVEIYNMDRTLQHVIDDPTIVKFRPTAITVASNGTVIIASHFSHCLHMYSPVGLANDTNRYAYKQFKLGGEGSQIHQFYQPAGIAIDKADGYLYVCDRGNYRLQVFNPEGICERVIELFLNVKKKYRIDPVRVALQKDSDQLLCITGPGDALCFIPKYTTGRIYVQPIFVSDQNGLGLENAAGLAVDAHGRIFISDTGHNRVVVCTPDGNYITSFSAAGDGFGQLKRPCGLTVTADGTVAVTDPGNKRLQLFGHILTDVPLRNEPPTAQVSQSDNLSDDTTEHSIIKL